MGDRFHKDIEIPDVPIGLEIPAPDPGFLQLVGRDGKLAVKNSAGQETIIEPQVQTQLNIDGGMAATVFQNYLLRLDFGANGASINPTGTP